MLDCTTSPLLARRDCYNGWEFQRSKDIITILITMSGEREKLVAIGPSSSSFLFYFFKNNFTTAIDWWMASD